MCAGAVKGLPRALPLPPCLSARMLIQLLRIRPLIQHMHAAAAAISRVKGLARRTASPPLPRPHPPPSQLEQIETVIQGGGVIQELMNSRAVCSKI